MGADAGKEDLMGRAVENTTDDDQLHVEVCL